MTVREFARSIGLKNVGKLKKVVVMSEKYDVKTDTFVENKISFYVDDIGNEFHHLDGAWLVITVDGDCIS